MGTAGPPASSGTNALFGVSAPNRPERSMNNIAEYVSITVGSILNA